ncbi:hypothetical protein AT1219_50120 [Vibrio alginolyticus]
MTSSFDLELAMVTVTLNGEGRGDSESIARLCGKKGSNSD